MLTFISTLFHGFGVLSEGFHFGAKTYVEALRHWSQMWWELSELLSSTVCLLHIMLTPVISVL